MCKLARFLEGSGEPQHLARCARHDQNQTHWAYKILSSQSLGTYLRACDIFLLPHDSMCG